MCSTGSAYINGKEIKDIINSIAAEMQSDKGAYDALKIDEKLSQLCDKIKKEILEHLTKYNYSPTNFIFSHFNRNENRPQVFIIRTRKADKDTFDPDKDKDDLISFEERSHLKIITDGQDLFVDRLIFGSLYTNITDVKSGCINYIVDKFKPTDEEKTKIIDEIQHIDFLKTVVTDDVFYVKFRDLSLQEAVDLAALLIKIVMDIQIYTEKIPTVGGVIRLAVISKQKGFDWISGDEIIRPKII